MPGRGREEEDVMKGRSRVQVGWVPVQVRSGRQRRVVEPCSRWPCWHWKSTLLPTWPHTHTQRKRGAYQYTDPNANRLPASNLKRLGKTPLTKGFFFSFFNDYLQRVKADGDNSWRRWPVFVMYRRREVTECDGCWVRIYRRAGMCSASLINDFLFLCRYFGGCFEESIDTELSHSPGCRDITEVAR